MEGVVCLECVKIEASVPLTVGLSLPHSVCQAPESRKHKEDRKLVWVRLPEQQNQDTGQVGDSS